MVGIETERGIFIMNDFLQERVPQPWRLMPRDVLTFRDVDRSVRGRESANNPGVKQPSEGKAC